jgi:ABC-2 type transport system permease protein
MKLSHKLRAVIHHEFVTIVRQPSFWISLFALPLLIGVVMLIGYFTDSSDTPDINKQQEMSIAVIDESGIILPDISSQFGIRPEPPSKQTALQEDVKNGNLDGLIVYPAAIESSGEYLVFADNTDQDNGSVITELGRSILQQSLLAPLEDEQAALAISGGTSITQTFVKGKPSRELSQMVVPGIFLVLFYIVLVFSVGYALTSISEEKENRSIEMVLSYVKPRTLILGKLVAIILVTLFQLFIIGIVATAAFFIAKSLGNNLSLPFKISDLTFVPVEILFGLAFLVCGFIFYVALMAMIGAIFPSSKEASGFSSLFFLLPAVPFWGLNAITNQPESTFTQILTYFPVTSPTTILFRNAAGNLGGIEGLVSLAILIVATVVVVFLAAKAFRLGTLEYTNRIKFSSLLK